MSGHVWPYSTNSNDLMRSLSLVIISMYVNENLFWSITWNCVQYNLRRYFYFLRNQLIFILSYLQFGSAPKTTQRKSWGFWERLSIHGHTQAKVVGSDTTFLINFCLQKIKDIHAFHPEILIIKETCIWLDQSILAQSLWSRIFSDMWFAQENRLL